MRIPTRNLIEGARWLTHLRWVGCLGIFGVIWLTSSGLGIVTRPAPLYAIGGAVLLYNVIFRIEAGRRRPRRNVQAGLCLQITLDLVALTLLLYFAGLARNPFIFYFVFHMIISCLVLPGRLPYAFAGLASLLVGAVLLLQHLGWIPVFALHLAAGDTEAAVDHAASAGLYSLGLFIAFSSTLWITVYFTNSLLHHLERAQAEMRQKEKMAGIGQLVAGIAHQISNPLDGLQNCLLRIGKAVQDDGQLRGYVRLMTEALDRIERTAKRVQAFARPRGLELGETDVNQAVASTLQLLREGLRPGVTLTPELGEVPPVRGDPFTLQEVVFNLCTNALAAMPEGGRLTIRTFTTENDALPAGEGVAIEVTDTGGGIPPERMDKVFEPFFTTRAQSGGTGLGLALCRLLVSEMGGWIEVRSAVGEGTTFRVLLEQAPARKS